MIIKLALHLISAWKHYSDLASVRSSVDTDILLQTNEICLIF